MNEIGKTPVTRWTGQSYGCIYNVIPQRRPVMARMAATLLFALVTLGVTVPAMAQTPTPAPTTAVLVNLTIKPDVDRAQMVKVMPDEVRATLKLYLDGKIQQWYSRSDGRGVMFILNATDVAAARAVMEELPLSKANLANYDYTALGPLTPLRALLAVPAGGKDDR